MQQRGNYTPSATRICLRDTANPIRQAHDFPGSFDSLRRVKSTHSGPDGSPPQFLDQQRIQQDAVCARHGGNPIQLTTSRKRRPNLHRHRLGVATHPNAISSPLHHTFRPNGRCSLPLGLPSDRLFLSKMASQQSFLSNGANFLIAKLSQTHSIQRVPNCLESLDGVPVGYVSMALVDDLFASRTNVIAKRDQHTRTEH
jgi:hypothetical protein